MRYEKLRSLGSGATAETFLCKDNERGGRLVAQKIFRPEWAKERPDLIDHEFRTLAGLGHPYIAAIEDFGDGETGPYLASEYVDGETLLDHLHGADQARVIFTFFQVLEALDYLFFRNVVHLDLKPQNVLVRRASGSRGPEVKLIDFGLASPSAGGSKSTSEAIGSPPYTAPEFALRRGVDTRSDLYSVGVLLYKALAGRLPFEGDDPVAILNQQLSRDPVPLKELNQGIPRGLSDYVSRLTAREPVGRFESPRVALAKLGEALGESFPRAPMAPVPLFEDPDLVFRKKESSDLLREILTRGGRWVVRGGTGMGKTFLARWLERSLWRKRRPVTMWKGEKVVLSGSSSSSDDRTMVIIDDADEGPTEAWVEARGLKNVVVLGETLDGFRSADWNGRELKPLTRGEIEKILKETVGGTAPVSLVAEWADRAAGNPREFVGAGRDLLRCGLLRREGIGWKWGATSAEIKTQPGADRLLQILRTSQISLDADMLALWTDRSVVEVEENIEEFLRQGGLERSVVAGRVVYRAGEVALAEQSLPALDSGEILKCLQGLYDDGRYRDGLEMLRGVSDCPPSLQLMKARLLGGAGFHDEALSLLSDDFIEGLRPSGEAEACETAGKSHLFLGRMPEATTALDKALMLFQKEGDRDGESRVLMHLGILKQRSGRMDEAEIFYKRALESAAGARLSNLLRGVSELNLANLYYDASDWERAGAMYESSLEHLRQTRHSAVTAQAYLNAATLSFYQEKLLRAAHLCREALRLALECRYLLTQGRSLLLLSMIDERSGNPGRQGERISEAIAIFNKAGLPFEEAQSRIHQAYFLEGGGRLDEAEKEACRAIEVAEAAKAPDLEAQGRVILGKILGRTGRRSEGVENLQTALRHFGEKNPVMRQECERELKKLKGAAHE